MCVFLSILMNLQRHLLEWTTIMQLVVEATHMAPYRCMVYYTWRWSNSYSLEASVAGLTVALPCIVCLP